MGRTDIEQKTSLERVLNQYKVSVFALLVTLIGVILAIIPFLEPKYNLSILADLGIALIPSGIVAAFVEYFLRNDFLSDLRKIQMRQDLSAQLEKLGVINIFENRGAQGTYQDPIFGYIARMACEDPDKVKSVSILGLSIEPFKNLVGDANIERLLKSGCKLRFLNLDPEGEAARKRSADQGQPGLLDSIRSFDSWIKSHKEQLKIDRSLKGSIEIAKYDLMPTMHITIINEEKAFVNFYPVFGATWEFPVIEVQQGYILSKAKKQFDEVWKRSRLVN
jgi:hypothetical protein